LIGSHGAAIIRTGGDEGGMEHQEIGTRLPPAGLARVALFVDGDNLSTSLSGVILASAGLLGSVDLRRVYCAEGGPKNWDAAPGFQVRRVPGAKNGADILLCIEAAEAACEGRFERFVIASDDRDFSHLAHWLRERGFHVLGLGTGKSPEGWRAACSEFEVLKAEESKASKPARAVATSEVDLMLRGAIGPQSSGRPIMEVGQRLSKAGVRPPEGCTWRTYMATRPEFYDLDPRGLGARVRWVGA
jgi:hypothetical protein